MLRASIASSNRLLNGAIPPRAVAQWLVVANVRQSRVGQRTFADTKKPERGPLPGVPGADATILPGSQSKAAASPPSSSASPAPGSSITPATPSSSTIPQDNVPLTPPPPATKIQTAPPTSIGASSTPPPPPKASPTPSSTPPPPSPRKKSRRFRNIFLLSLITAVVYAGGVWYALVDDNFHDFFTEYIPFGEEVVLYLQERDFHRRFPNAIRHSNRVAGAPREQGNRVTIPSRSGLSWKVSEEDHKPDHELQPKGRHMNATEANTPKSKPVEPPPPASKPSTTRPVKVQEKPKPAPPPKEASNTEPPKDERPAAIPPTTLIDPLKIDQAEDPLVQDLVKIVNDIITTVNADNAANKYALPMAKAKDELSKVGQRIIGLKNTAEASAQERLKEREKQFDDAHKELLRRIEEVQMEDAARFREEFEAEREKIAVSFAEKLKTETQRSSEVAEQRLKNELLEQAIEMKRKFVSDVESLVEKEREGRLSKLSDLQTNVADLEKMASDWNGVIDTNLQTQQLQVAVDAVRSTLARADIPRPFVRELAALKEIANDDPVVDAAIASINPTAYQRGIPNSAQLVDRFRSVSTEVRKASLLPQDAGIASHAASFLLSKVLFKKSGLAQGDDVESILTRTETLLEEGNLDGAAREMNGLSGWAKTLSQDWLGDVRKVLEVKQALEVIETEARLQCLRVE